MSYSSSNDENITNPPETMNQLRELYYLEMHDEFYKSFLDIINTNSEGRVYGINVAQFNDIGNKYLTSSIPAEIINLLVLTLFDNIMQNIPRSQSLDPQINPQIERSIHNPKQGHFINLLNLKGIPSKDFSSPQEWSTVTNYFYMFISLINKNGDATFSRELLNLFNGGTKLKTLKRVKNKRTKKNKKIKKSKSKKMIKMIKMKNNNKNRKSKKYKSIKYKI